MLLMQRPSWACLAHWLSTSLQTKPLLKLQSTSILQERISTVDPGHFPRWQIRTRFCSKPAEHEPWHVVHWPHGLQRASIFDFDEEQSLHVFLHIVFTISILQFDSAIFEHRSGLESTHEGSEGVSKPLSRLNFGMSGIAWQASRLQMPVSLSLPMHLPSNGHDRVLVRKPPSQVLLQSLHSDQGVKLSFGRATLQNPQVREQARFIVARVLGSLEEQKPASWKALHWPIWSAQFADTVPKATERTFLAFGFVSVKPVFSNR